MYNSIKEKNEVPQIESKKLNYVYVLKYYTTNVILLKYQIKKKR